jgi:hypothetical protein
MTKTQDSKFKNERFFGRKTELSLAWEYINEGCSLKLAAPRRIGKTFFATEMLCEAQNKGWSAIYINLEGCKNELAFIDKFISELKEEKWYHKVGKYADNIVTILAKVYAGADEWERQKINIYLELEKILKHSENTIIVLDELTVFLGYLNEKDKDGNLEDVKFFLHWLRSLRETPNPKIRWIFCSSISIDSFITKHELTGTLNNVKSFKIGELCNNEPVDFVKKLAESAKLSFSDEVITYMLEKLGKGKIPYYIKILFDNIRTLHILNNTEINNDLVDKAYQEAIQTASNFNHWIERLKDYEEDEIYVKTILNNLAVAKNGKKENHLYTLIYNETEKNIDKRFKQLGKRLEDEGYIIISDGIWTFRSPFLKGFWTEETKAIKVSKKAK